MLPTVVVYARSLFETIRCSISCGSNPLKFQMIAMTGMSTTGKMSTGVRKIDSTPRIRINIDITINVYGRRNANRTIHILGLNLSLSKGRSCVFGRTPAAQTANIKHERYGDFLSLLCWLFQWLALAAKVVRL